ncbi:hypothetical protein A2160_01250 [Candidatus Beckwithbacteria bacterium RBG_13_42_9]|uniref:Dipeptidylpeptidase IV N-terminal domain-containing protein n=1 Tax=Candidatus Beckwithbacteria bacterium RBG_13_42_9 TaxID=1797457 RepID=A0A1F5E443_9BACT|nr:MAG: hypothetical protein A2160_01250 [Candidatus Beckwithbacteria bacterium RBG_13_42_9]
MIRFKLPLLIVSLFLVAFAVGAFLQKYYSKADQPRPNNSSLNQPEKLAAQAQRSEIRSGDGTVTLISKVESKPDQSQDYSFFVANLSGNDQTERLIFTRTLAAGGNISLPGNSWSPDNKYLFLKEKDQTGSINFLVLKASGEAFADGEQYLDVISQFSQKMPGYLLQDATGWASPTLLNITTMTENGTKKGPSYWLEVTSGAILMHR